MSSQSNLGALVVEFSSIKPHLPFNLHFTCNFFAINSNKCDLIFMILERIFHFFMIFWPRSTDLRQVDLNAFLQQQIFIAFGAHFFGSAV